MNRRLLLLNVVLLLAVAYAGYQFRRQWAAAKDRESATLNRPVKPVPAPAFTPAPVEPPVRPSGYVDIAQKMLFDKSRNPDVPIEPPPPPPPKPPMPPLPVYHGMMNLGGAMAILSVNANAPHKAVKPGETIGQFTLVDVNSEGLTLEWNGETIRKSVEELSKRTVVASAEPQDAGGRTEAPAAKPAAPPPPAPTGPGETTQFGFKTCSVNDGRKEGEVVDGYRKVIHKTVFGEQCTYEPVK